MLLFWSLRYSGLFLHIVVCCANRTATILKRLLLHHDIQVFLTEFYDLEYQMS